MLNCRKTSVIIAKPITSAPPAATKETHPSPFGFSCGYVAKKLIKTPATIAQYNIIFFLVLTSFLVPFWLSIVSPRFDMSVSAIGAENITTFAGKDRGFEFAGYSIGQNSEYKKGCVI
jgi:hypothetical protein